jgi:hypothetical protein
MLIVRKVTVDEVKQMPNLAELFDKYAIEVKIKELPIIPNCLIEKVLKILAKDGEETVEILYSRSFYGADKNWVKTENDETFKYPCVYSINTKNELSLKYSSVNNKGHFGVQKIIIGDGCNFGIYKDIDGTYGMTQWAFGIIDDVKNFDNIVKALSSKEFQEINKATTSKNTQGIGVVDRNVIKYFRKDFWKEFI